MREEGITLRDATQAGLLVVTMTHKMLFEESAIFGADHHEMAHIERAGGFPYVPSGMALPRTDQGSAHRLPFFPAVARLRSRGRKHQAHSLLSVLAMRGTIHRSRCPFRPRVYKAITFYQMAQF